MKKLGIKLQSLTNHIGTLLCKTRHRDQFMHLPHDLDPTSPHPQSMLIKMKLVTLDNNDHYV